MSDVMRLMGLLHDIRCFHKWDLVEDPKHMLFADEGPEGITQYITVGQTLFCFDKDGRFLASCSTERGIWHYRVDAPFPGVKFK